MVGWRFGFLGGAGGAIVSKTKEKRGKER